VSDLSDRAAALAGRDLPLATGILREAIRIPADHVDRDADAGGDPACGLSNHEGPRLEYLRRTIVEIGAVRAEDDVGFDDFGNLWWTVSDPTDGVAPADKTVVYFLARHRSGEVVLSDEHSAFSWAPLAEAIDTLPFDSLVHIVREAALWLKDPALFDIEPATQQDALDHLTAQPQITDPLVRHLQGGAHLARFFAEALREAGIPIHVEAAAAGTILHDIGRARGDHEDHQRAGLKYLRTGTLAPYAFACVSHFTKGAPSDALVAAGVDPAMLEEVGGLVDLSSLTWEEKCAALADGCMRGDRAAPPADRYADLRTRYDADELITLQERYTETIRAGPSCSRSAVDRERMSVNWDVSCSFVAR